MARRRWGRFAGRGAGARKPHALPRRKGGYGASFVRRGVLLASRGRTGYRCVVTALAGYFSFDGRPSAAPVPRMLNAQAMYGQTSALRSAGSATIGRRLARLLPEDLHDVAPQIGGEGSLLLVADLRLDNREELARDLSITAARLSTMPDAALLMRTFEAWSEAAVKRLVGDFAFALWDSREERLLLGRDFIGGRPLHYHASPTFFAFASMPKGLHALPEVPPAVHRESMAAFLALAPETTSATYFAGVEKVLPGHIVTVTRRGISSEPYWTAPAAGTAGVRTAAECEEAVRAELDRAVSACLRGGNGKVASHLSGGLDSSAVTATAARALGSDGKVVAYTAVPRDGYRAAGGSRWIADEGPLAAEVAALYANIEHVLIPASGGSPLEHLDLYFHACERPILNLCNSGWSSAILTDARQRGLTVLLTGQNGNMSFSYDGMAALSQMLREGRIIDLAGAAVRLAARGTRLATIGAQVLGPLLPRPVWAAISRLRGRGSGLTDITALNPDMVPAMERMAAERRLDTSYRPRGDPVELRTWVLQRIDSGNYNKGMLGGWGVDVRDPTADRRLVELCLAIPPEQFIAGGIPRSLARRALADRLPASLLNERRKGYQAADWHEAMTRSRPQLVEEIARSAEISLSSELLDTAKMARLAAEWPTEGWHERSTTEAYRLALLRGVSAAHFIRKATGANV